MSIVDEMKRLNIKIASLEDERTRLRIEIMRAGDDALASAKDFGLLTNERDAAKKLAQDRLQEYLEMKAELAEASEMMLGEEAANRMNRERADKAEVERNAATTRVEELEKVCGDVGAQVGYLALTMAVKSKGRRETKALADRLEAAKEGKGS